MRSLRFRPELWLLLVAALTACVGPVIGTKPPRRWFILPRAFPARPADTRLEQIDSQIASLVADIADEDPNSTADLDARIAQDQSTISSLTAEAAMEQSTQSDELRNLRFREQQESAVIRSRLTEPRGGYSRPRTNRCRSPASC